MKLKYGYLEDVGPELFGPGLDAAEASQRSLLSTQQQLALMSLVREDEAEAKQQVVAHNLRLVINIAKRYSDRGVGFIELVREGIQGLIHALENFELEGGFRFASYAARCVRESIERAIMNRQGGSSPVGAVLADFR